MFQNAVLDIAIGLVLMYLVLSLLCTTINEYIATWMGLRAKNLKGAIENLIDNDALRHQFYNHGLINTSCDASGGHSSYLGGKTVAMALIGSLDTGKPIPGYEDVAAAVNKLPESSVKSALQAMLTEAGGSLDRLRESMAGWYDGAMDRLGGLYKRKLKMISLAIGIAVAAILNADSLTVGTLLWRDAGLRGQIVQQAQTYLNKCGDKCDTVTEPKSLKDVQTQLSATSDTLRPLPIGWTEWPPNFWTCAFWRWFALKLGGIVITGIALSLGAPFWFDLLSKFMKVRGTGDKPKRGDANT